MSSNNLTILITALKKTVAFQDDLVKKLAGTSLIQRAINKAFELGVDQSKIYLLTDSEEICLIAERNNVQAYLDPKLIWNKLESAEKLSQYLKTFIQNNEYVLVLSPYAPLVSVELILRAKKALVDSDKDLLKPTKMVKRSLYDDSGQSIFATLFDREDQIHTMGSQAFFLLRSDFLIKKLKQKFRILSWPVQHEMIEIQSYQDWWICEKLLNRKRIVFRVIGNDKVGMGHIYRALSLAHEITDHEILFVSDIENTIAVNKLAGYEYWLGIYEKGEILDSIISLKPDLVINDILSTTEADVMPLRENGIKVINFEDLGEGAKLANLTINELYDTPQIEGDNILWGYQYFFVRDEFYDAKSHRFKKKVDTILLTFGGTDQNNLSDKVYEAIHKTCQLRRIRLHIVTGAGYKGYAQLKAKTKGDPLVSLNRSTGVMSRIMEKSQIAIVSNGRTVYELAHMNIPGIVISQHQRESTHNFASTETGFVSFGLYESENSEAELVIQLKKLLDDEGYRRQLFNQTKKYRFNDNKKKVLKAILAFLPN